VRQSLLVAQKAKKASAQIESLPPPVGGWNVRDSLANMDPLDAVVLENMFPNVSSVDLRGGSANWATGISGQVQTLMSYDAGATSKFFAISSAGSIYDVTTQGAVGAPAVSGLLSGYWEYTNITTAGGGYLYAVNGLDSPRLYDGASWTAITGVSTPAITGVTTSTLSNILLFKHRLWFIQKNTLKAWYLPTDAVGGAAAVFDLSAVATLGGYLVDMEAWTIDAGYGADDNLAFITSEGEVIVYRGTDPASASTWTEVGLWKLGAPIGNRCMTKYGGDLIILTQDGLVPMTAAIQSDRLDPRVALSDKIQGAIASATATYAGSSTPTALGWATLCYPKKNALWINVPVAVGSQQQYVMNAITKAWCNFTGWAANCWELFNDEPYFGGSGVVRRAWDSTYADVGSNIATTSLQAFNYFGSRGVKKYFTRARISLFTNGRPQVLVGVNVDFDVTDNTAPLSFVPSSYGLWDSGLWDVALWGSGTTISNTWLGVAAPPGYCGAVQMKTASMGMQISWASTDVVYQQGWAGV
jgi:hypothetical protein